MLEVLAAQASSSSSSSSSRPPTLHPSNRGPRAATRGVRSALLLLVVLFRATGGCLLANMGADHKVSHTRLEIPFLLSPILEHHPPPPPRKWPSCVAPASLALPALAMPRLCGVSWVCKAPSVPPRCDGSSRLLLALGGFSSHPALNIWSYYISRVYPLWFIPPQPCFIRCGLSLASPGPFPGLCCCSSQTFPCALL